MISWRRSTRRSNARQNSIQSPGPVWVGVDVLLTGLYFDVVIEIGVEVVNHAVAVVVAVGADDLVYCVELIPESLGILNAIVESVLVERVLCVGCSVVVPFGRGNSGSLLLICVHSEVGINVDASG